MEDFARKFGQRNSNAGTYEFSAARQGTIVGLLCIGCLFGSLIAGRIADKLGRRLPISVSAISLCAGTIFKISSEHVWSQFTRSPSHRRRHWASLCSGAHVSVREQSCDSPGGHRLDLQLFIIIGIWTAEMVTYGTHMKQKSAAWRVSNGFGFLWALILGRDILSYPSRPDTLSWATSHTLPSPATSSFFSAAGTLSSSLHGHRNGVELVLELHDELLHAVYHRQG